MIMKTQLKVYFRESKMVIFLEPYIFMIIIYSLYMVLGYNMGLIK